MAEPFRVLVVANFPANFSDEAARRLVSIASSGAALRRLHADQRRHQAAAAAGLRPGRPGAALRQPRLEGRPVRSGRTRDFGQFPLPLDAAARRRACYARSCSVVGERGQGRQPRRGAVRVHRPAAGAVVDRRQPRRHRRAARPGRRDQAAAPAARPGHLAARADRRQDRLGQIDAAARADHQPGAASTAPTRSSCT